MGADLLLYICNVPGTRSINEFSDACKGLIASMSGDTLRGYFEDVHDNLEDITDKIAEELGLPAEEEPPEEEVLKGLRVILLDDLVESMGYLSAGYRDVGVITMGGIDYFMTGGMSWGDEPTDAGPHINKLAYTGADMIGLIGSTYGCGNCGTDFPWESLRRTHDGTMFCPECGSNEVGKSE